MDSSIGIEKFYNQPAQELKYKLKETPEDFVVQEVVNGITLTICPIVDIDKLNKAEELLKNLPTSELTKEQRKEIYSFANYHPIYRVYTKDSKLEVEKYMNDIFVFTVLKYNYSSNSLINLLAKRLGVSPMCIQTGGTKDKRAITLQEVSVNCSFDKLFSYAYALSQNKKLYFENLGFRSDIIDINTEIKSRFSDHFELQDLDLSEDIAIFNIRRGESKKLGDLDGNQFTITLKGVEAPIVISKNFINYFGPQRFGINCNNHIIGKKIVNQDYDGAIEMILKDQNVDTSSYNSVQKQIMRMLEGNNKPKYIINRLPKHFKMIYLHAHQSFIFNNTANQRLDTGKVNVKEDVVFENASFKPAQDNSDMKDIYLPLQKMDDKLLKGGYRKMIETAENLEITKSASNLEMRFFLKKSCYATVFLREIFGAFPAEEDEE